MNVTSLLNTSAAAQAAGGRLPTEQAADANMTMYQTQERMVPMRTSSDSRLASRSSRTPWDAGGYSLPLTLNVKKGQMSPASKPAYHTELTSMDNVGSTSPKSPKHKFSDSRSSLSSYTTMSSSNSCHSRSHSRISSLSTVSEYQPLSSFGSDTTSTERRTSVPESGMSCPTVVEIQPPSPRRLGLDDISDASDNDSVMISDRARSPSDAVLLRNRGLTGSASPSDPKAVGLFLHPDSPTSLPARSHKRTVSAPDFPSLNSMSRPTHYPSFGPMAEPTPPKSPTQGDDSHQVGDANVTNNGTAGLSAQGQLVATSPISEEPKCMFVNPCTTGSSLRKAISHIFGRNKLCTKAIPNHIWVHYCRKHYQRSRYRNATDYALRQVDLVLLQIQKVQDWSDGNTRSGRRGEGVLKHWTLQARKREAKRLQDAGNRKRAYHDEDEDDDSALSSGTAIPDWLQDKLNQDYGTTRMLEIVEEVKEHMNAGDITQIPDIEILPEILTDGNESRTKTTVRRASNANGHRHTKSEIYRTPSMSAYNQRASLSIPDQKRFRSGTSPYNGMIQNLAHRPVMSMNQPYPYQMHEHNSFAAMANTQADHGFWNGGYTNNSVLPQPVTQRQGSITPQEANPMQQSYAPQGRSMHARSMSENPAMRNSGYANTEFRFPPQQPNPYQQHQQDVYSNMNAPPQYGYQQPAAHGYNNPFGMTRDTEPQENAFGTYYQPQQDWRGQHHRIQSSPAINHQPNSIPGGSPPMPAVAATQSMLPSMNSMGHANMYANNQHMGLANVPKENGFGDYQQSRPF